MAGIVKLTITLGRGDAARSRDLIIDPDEIPMGFNEDMEIAQETKKWADMNRAFAELIGLTHEEFRQVKAGDFRRIMDAVQQASKEATAGPNG